MSKFCVITEKYRNLIGFLVWVVGMVALLSLDESLSAAQSDFTPNTFIVLLSNSITSGPK